MLKREFQKLQKTIVKSVNPPGIMDFLFQEDVIGSDDLSLLQKSKDDTKQQCRDLLAMLHESENPHAFIQLYRAIKHESHLRWIIDLIDKNIDQSFTELLQQMETTGKGGEVRTNGWRKI